MRRTSIRVRTTLAAVLVVAVALLAGAAALVLAVRGSLRDGAETTAEHRADALVAQVDAGQVPVVDDEADDEPEDVVWQVTRPDGEVLAASASLQGPLTEDGTVDLPGADHSYVVVTEDSDDGHVVAVAVSLEDVDETTAALAAPLLLGLPALLLVVAGTTWLVVGRALRPVERIRREVEEITGARLERRVSEPATRDEVGRLARTMNAMLARLQDSRDRQEQFVADASHELRSPLASIRQVAEVAQAHPAALPDGELAETVLEEAVRVQALVEQLLVLTRAGEGRARAPRTEVDLDDLALGAVRRVARAGLDVDTTAVAAARLLGDPVALGQVVRNLVDNAARHARSRLAVAVVQHPGGVVLSVEDDGPGIAPADRERVFERFVRLDEARARDAGGSGLGLAIVREVVTGHGGAVAVEDGTFGGARFVVRLPA
ncbi:sensor histidine kinase [Nocardioides sp. LML1-1-1.1]|uniref:sensor histidine kinase n=1 Tax=Nocardioides sp. LML1-1-1.1 TaxID=3135248 RepID=UPI00342C84D4